MPGFTGFRSMRTCDRNPGLQAADLSGRTQDWCGAVVRAGSGYLHNNPRGC